MRILEKTVNSVYRKDLHKIIPEGDSGLFRIEHINIDKEQSATKRYAALMSGDYNKFIQEGTCVKLTRNAGLIMSNAFAEKFHNFNFVYSARGRVLVSGLGLGMILFHPANNKDVSEIVVVEKHKEVIDLVWPHIEPYMHKKARVIHDDIFQIEFNHAHKFDTIYFDIWDVVSSENKKQFDILVEKFAPLRSETGTIDAWRLKEFYE